MLVRSVGFWAYHNDLTCKSNEIAHDDGSANPLWGLLFLGPSKEREEAGSLRKQQQRNMKQQETKQPLNVELALARGSDNAGVRVSSASTHFLLYTLRAARLGQHQPVSACFEGTAFRCGRSLQGRLQALSAPFVPLLVGCLGGRLWAEVLRAMFMSACGRPSWGL